jgi:hypothetical protein
MVMNATLESKTSLQITLLGLLIIKILINMEPEVKEQAPLNKLQEAQANKMNNIVDDRQGV